MLKQHLPGIPAIVAVFLFLSMAFAAVSVTTDTNLYIVTTSEYNATLIDNTASGYHGAVEGMSWLDYGTTDLSSATTYYDSIWLYRTPQGTITTIGATDTPVGSAVVENNTIRSVIRFDYTYFDVNYYFYEDYYQYSITEQTTYPDIYDDGIVWRTRFDSTATNAENFGLVYTTGSKSGPHDTSVGSTNFDTYDITGTSWNSWYGDTNDDLCVGMVANNFGTNLVSATMDYGDGTADEVSYSGGSGDVAGVNQWLQISTGGAGNTTACSYDQYLLRTNAPTFTGISNFSSATLNTYEYIYDVTTSGTQNITFNVTGSGSWTNTYERVYFTVSNADSGLTVFRFENGVPTILDADYTGTEYMFSALIPKSGDVTIKIMEPCLPELTVESPLNQTYAGTSVWANVTATQQGGYIDKCGYYLDGGAYVQLTNDTVSHFYANLTSLSETTHNIYYECNCTLGYSNQSETVYFTTNVAPIVTITSPTNTTYWKDWVWVNATINENADWCGYSLNGAANVTMSGSGTSWYSNATGLITDNYQVDVFCNDSLGTFGSDTEYFSIDITTYECMIEGDGGFDYTGGNLDIINGDNVTCSLQDWDMDGEIWVSNNSKLILDGVNVTFLNAGDGDNGIWVDDGGNLTVIDSHITTNGTAGFYFVVEGNTSELYVIDSTIENVGYDYSDYDRGLEVWEGYLYMSGSEIWGFEYVIYLKDTIGSEIADSNFTSGEHGIYLTNADDTIIRGNYFDSMDYGIDSWSSNGTQVYDNDFYNSTSRAVSGGYDDYFNISYNRFVDNGYASIQFNSPNTYLTVEYNNVTGTLNTGIDIANADYPNIRYNNVTDSGIIGIELSSPYMSHVDYNYVSDTLTGIYEYPCQNYQGTCTVSDNWIVGNTVENCEVGMNVDVPPGWAKGTFLNHNVSFNNIDNCEWGLYTDATPEQSFFHNNYVSNSDYGYLLYVVNSSIYQNDAVGNDIAYHIAYDDLTIFEYNDDVNSTTASIDSCMAEESGTEFWVYDHISEEELYTVGAYEVNILGVPSGEYPPATAGVEPIEFIRIDECPMANNSWADMYLYYNPALVSEENNMLLYKWDGYGWIDVPGSGVDTGNDNVYANITSYSVFAAGETFPVVCDNQFDGYCPGYYECPLDPDCILTADPLFNADVPLTYVNTTYEWTVRYLDNFGSPISDGDVWANVTFPNFTVATYPMNYDAVGGVYTTDFITDKTGEYFIQVWAEHGVQEDGYGEIYKTVYLRGEAQIIIDDTGEYSEFVCIDDTTLQLTSIGLSCQYDDTECVDYSIAKEKFCEYGCDDTIGCLSNPLLPGITSSGELEWFMWILLALMIISLIVMVMFYELSVIGMIGSFLFGFLVFTLMPDPLSYLGMIGILGALFYMIKGVFE